MTKQKESCNTNVTEDIKVNPVKSDKVFLPSSDETEEYSLLLSGYVPAVAQPGTVLSYPVATASLQTTSVTSDYKVSLSSTILCEVSIFLLV